MSFLVLHTCNTFFRILKNKLRTDDINIFMVDFFQGSCGSIHHDPFGGIIGGGIGGGYSALKTDGGREARVSRYREKRRTRLFSKKIRYEVRKLNAEKRPRMKGRFVKRVGLVAGPAAFALQTG